MEVQKMSFNRSIFHELTRKQKIVDDFVESGKDLDTYCNVKRIDKYVFCCYLEDIKQSSQDTYNAAWKLLKKENANAS